MVFTFSRRRQFFGFLNGVPRWLFSDMLWIGFLSGGFNVFWLVLYWGFRWMTGIFFQSYNAWPPSDIHIVLVYGLRCICFMFISLKCFAFAAHGFAFCRSLWVLPSSPITDIFGVVFYFVVVFVWFFFYVGFLIVFMHCFTCFLCIGYLDHFICRHHFRRHQLFSCQHDVFSASL